MEIVFPWYSDKRCIFKRALKPIQNEKLVQKEKEERRNNKQSQFDHVDDTSKWYLKECIEYVSNLPDGSYLNFSDLARKYGIKNENGDFLKNEGQIIQNVLEENNIDMTKFDYLRKNNSCRLWRKKIVI